MARSSRSTASPSAPPWGTAGALIAGSVTVLAGVAQRVAPTLIVCRAACAAAMVGIVVHLCIACLRMKLQDERPGEELPPDSGPRRR